MKFTHLIILFAVALTTSFASAQTDTTFTYQGELQENGSPANGLYNLEFSLWDAEVAGNAVSVISSHPGVPVVHGKFSVEVDFGANVFDNSYLWLLIVVNGNALTPRTPVTRAPYAIQTRGIFVDNDKQVGIGTSTPATELEVADTNADGGTAVGVTAGDAAGSLAAYSSAFPVTHLADRTSLFSDAFSASGLDLRADGPTSDIRFYTGGVRQDPQQQMKQMAFTTTEANK